MSVNISQTEWTTGIRESELFVVDTELVQDSGLNVVYMDWIFNRSESEFISFSECLTSANASSGHPHGKRLRVMVSAEFSS